MNTTYVCGHRNPDTDSIVSAIAYASLMNSLGDNGYVAARLGHLNDETAFLLKRFGFDPPMFLPTVRTQVSDIEIDQPPLLSKEVPVSHAWEVLKSAEGFNILPVTNEDGTLYGVVTSGIIAQNDMDSIRAPMVRDVPVFNVLAALEGRILNSEDQVFDTISGEVVIALPGAGEPLKGVKPGSIVICGQQEDVLERALALPASTVILCQSSLAEKYRDISADTCLIATPCDAYRAARLLYQAIPVSRIAEIEDLVTFHLDDFLDDVRDTVLQSRHRSYPVLNDAGHVVGALGRYHLLRPRRKRVVLVDHNEIGQSVPGLDQAELIGIIDHHRLGDVTTGYPVFMRNEPVGSATTIVATMYQEQGLLPGEKLAGLMAAAIVSDTVMFKSPTATPRDRRIAERLARIAGLELESLGREVFSANQLADKPAEQLLKTDFKEFHIADHRLGISQITTMDSGHFIRRLDELKEKMRMMRDEKHYDMVLLMITDVLKEGTELIYIGDREIIRQAFGLKDAGESRVFLPGVVSRKKQVVPALAVLWG